jgi:hypothetical protein
LGGAQCIIDGEAIVSHARYRPAGSTFPIQRKKVI